MDLYETLNCLRDDDINTIKKKYQELVVKHHPDKSRGEESEQFIRIRRAWEVLSDESCRRTYDSQLSNLELAQEATLWMEIKMEDMRECPDSFVYSCKCSGCYEIDLDQLTDLRQAGEADFLLGCDSCSLQILVQL